MRIESNIFSRHVDWEQFMVELSDENFQRLKNKVMDESERRALLKDYPPFTLEELNLKTRLDRIKAYKNRTGLSLMDSMSAHKKHFGASYFN